MDAVAWTKTITERLHDTFKQRLLFIGLQGSHVRGEATETSDIDIVVILDRLEMADLAAYRGIIQSMPEAEKACGFISGMAEIANWPKHELLQFKMETVSYHGSLESLLPKLSRDDVRQAVSIAAADIYHAACHSYLHADRKDYMSILKALYKATFFMLQAEYYHKNGKYLMKKGDLKEVSTGKAGQIMDSITNWHSDADAETLFCILIEHSGRLIVEA